MARAVSATGSDDPVRQQTYRVRSLFDLRAVYGRQAAVARGRRRRSPRPSDRDFVHVLANDCLASLPPLTFFQDAVVDSVGEQDTTFRLEHSALQPLVDVGRVFGARGAAMRSAARRSSASRSRARCCRSRTRSSARPPTRCASCSGSRAASASARARRARSCRRRCSAGTTARSSRAASGRFCGCSSSPPISTWLTTL